MRVLKSRRGSVAIAAASLAVLAGIRGSAHAATQYWDSNGNGTAGAGTTPTGNWGADSFWNTDPDGSGASPTTGWLANTDDAVFSAGADATGPWNLTVTGTQTANSVLVQEGNITIVSGAINTGANSFTIGAGARVNFPASTNFNSGGKVVLDGGTLFNTNPVTAISFLSASKALEVTANGGTVGYNDGVAGNAFTTIYSGNMLGTGGTTVNGGVGTLTKIGPDEFRVQGTNVPNSTFAKLVVNEGLYRIGATSTVVATADLAFGAAPLAPLPDAITLNGGSLGASLNFTAHANRGLTIGAAGGTINGSGGGVIIFPGQLSGSGTLTMTGGGGLTLSNTGNNTSFTGNLIYNGTGTSLTLSESLTTPELSGTGTGNISVASGKTLTVGSSNNSTSFAGHIAGAGGFVKNGTGILTMNPVTGEWTNTTGGVTINDGKILYGTSAAGFATTCNVTIAAPGTLDMNSVNDTFGGLAGAGTVLQGTGNLTLAGSAALNFSGTITTGGGFFRINRTGTSAQTLSGNNTLGVTTVDAGVLTLSGSNTMTSFALNGTTAVVSRVNFNNNNAVGSTTIAVGAPTNPGNIEFTNAAPNITLANNVTLAASANPIIVYSTTGNSLTQTGQISGDNGLLKNDTGAGAFTLAGDNSFIGGVLIQSRGLRIGHKNGFGTGTLSLGDAVTAPANAISIASTAALAGVNAVPNAVTVNRDFSIIGVTPTPFALELSGNVDLTGATRVVTVSSTAANTMSGVISNGGLTKAGAGTLDLTGGNVGTLHSNTYTGGTNVQAGTLIVNRLHGLAADATGTPNPVSITGGTLQIRESSPTIASGHPGGNNAFVSRPGSMITIANNGGDIVSLNPTTLTPRIYDGTLDLTNNDLVIDYDGASPIADVEDMIRAGRNGGSWNGKGIISSTAGSIAAAGAYTLGVIDNATPGITPFTTFSGQTVDTTTVLVKFVHRSDINMDGVVTFSDSVRFNGNYSEGTPTRWVFGDLNYNGVSDFGDSVIFNGGYDEALSSLPEPAAAGVFGLFFVGLARRRRGGVSGA